MKSQDFNENNFIKLWLISLHFILFHLFVFTSFQNFLFFPHQTFSKLRAAAEIPTLMHNLKGVEASSGFAKIL